VESGWKPLLPQNLQSSCLQNQHHMQYTQSPAANLKNIWVTGPLVVVASECLDSQM
jgi:hypothetical protein